MLHKQYVREKRRVAQSRMSRPPSKKTRGAWEGVDSTGYCTGGSEQQSTTAVAVLVA